MAKKKKMRSLIISVNEVKYIVLIHMNVKSIEVCVMKRLENT